MLTQLDNYLFMIFTRHIFCSLSNVKHLIGHISVQKDLRSSTFFFFFDISSHMAIHSFCIHFIPWLDMNLLLIHCCLTVLFVNVHRYEFIVNSLFDSFVC